MERIPEPELMTDPEQARAYASADFSEPHDRFVELFGERFPGYIPDGLVLDLGCGPADISIRFARAYPGCRILGVDGARAMLDEGLRAVAAAGLAERVQLVEGYLPGTSLPDVTYTAVISNSLLHHLRTPGVLWETIAAVVKPGTPVAIMDLMRPDSEQTVTQLVETHAADAPAILRRDFYRSLLAAYRPDEIRIQLQAAGLSHLSAEAVSDRHWMVAGRR